STDGCGVDDRSLRGYVVTAYALNAERGALIRQAVRHFPPDFIEDIYRMGAGGRGCLRWDTRRDRRQFAMMPHLQRNKSMILLDRVGSANKGDLSAAYIPRFSFE